MTARTWLTTDLIVPRTGNSVGVPTAWAFDRVVSLSAYGLLVTALSYAEPGVRVCLDDLPMAPDPDGPTLAEMVADLVGGGYLVPDADDGHYVLVHPARLAPIS